MKNLTKPIWGLLAVVVLAMTAAACTPEEQALFATLLPEQQEAVKADLAKKAEQAKPKPKPAAPAPSVQGATSATTCEGAMRQVWPSQHWAWGMQIMRRESGLQPGAANRSSTARGCWQLLMSLHGKRFAAVGCSAQQWNNALCNNKVAYELFKIAGKSPWAL